MKWKQGVKMDQSEGVRKGMGGRHKRKVWWRPRCDAVHAPLSPPNLWWHQQAGRIAPLGKVFIANGYHVSTVRWTFPSASRPREKDADEDTAKPMFLPYVRGVSEKMEKVCAPLGLKAIFRPQMTLRSIVMQVKQKTPMERKRNVVYEVPCRDCQLTYIGETTRTMKKRMTENKYAVKTGDSKNGIAMHAQKSLHSIDWEGAKVQATATGYWNRRTMEAIHIRKKGKSMNLDCVHLSPVWNPHTDPTWTAQHPSHRALTPTHWSPSHLPFMSPSHTFSNTFTLINFYTFLLCHPPTPTLTPSLWSTSTPFLSCHHPSSIQSLLLKVLFSYTTDEGLCGWNVLCYWIYATSCSHKSVPFIP